MSHRYLRAEVRPTTSENLLEITNSIHAPALDVLAECTKLAEIDHFLDTLHRCRRLELDDEAILDAVAEHERSEIVGMAMKYAQESRSQFVKTGKATVLDYESETGLKMVRVDGPDRDLIVQTIDEVASLPIDIGHENPIDSGAEMAECALLFAGGPHAISLSKAIEQLTRIMASDDDLDGATIHRWRSSYENSMECKKLLRVLRKFQSVLDEYYNDPIRFSAKYVVLADGEMEQRIKEIYDMWLLSYISDAYEKIQETRRLSKRRQRRKRRQEHGLSESHAEPSSTPTQVETAIGAAALEADHREKEPDYSIGDLAQHEPVNVLMPWHDSPVQAELYSVDAYGKRVFVVRTHLGGVGKIAESARMHTSHTDDKPDADRLLEKLAHKIASGIDPVSSRNAGIVQVTHARDELGTVWRNKGFFGNAMRAYFTLETVGNVLADGARIEGASGSEPCLVVLAETEKKNQVPTLRHITGLSYAAVRSKGAGAI